MSKARLRREAIIELFDDPNRVDYYLRQNPRRSPRSEYVEHDGKLLGVKLAVYLARGSDIGPDDVTSNEAKAVLRRMGFTNFVSKGEAELTATAGTITRVLETHRRVEATIWSRNPAIRTSAIQKANYRCQACDLRPVDHYLGPDDGCLEGHHISPMYAYHGSSKSVTVDDILCLCANCHRMIHHMIVGKKRAVTLAEFKRTLRN